MKIFSKITAIFLFSLWITYSFLTPTEDLFLHVLRIVLSCFVGSSSALLFVSSTREALLQERIKKMLED